MKKEMRVLLLGICAVATIIVFFGALASANFVCGMVQDDSDVSASWLRVKIYYPENPSNYSLCTVSAENNKYCCDPQDIKAVPWRIGKTVQAEVYDLERGYVAGPVTTVISGAGYDLFSDMQLEKILDVHSPSEKIYLKKNSVLLNVSSASRFTTLSYELRSGNDSKAGVLCQGCNHAELVLDDLDFGKYELTVKTSNGVEEFTERKNFSLLEYIEFSRSIECPQCKNGQAKSSVDNVDVHVKLKLSHEAEGTLVDYFPSDWEYSGDGEVEDFSSTHEMISWEVSGRDIEEVYTLTPPRTNILTRYYEFQSEFEGYSGKSDTVLLFRNGLLRLLKLKSSREDPVHNRTVVTCIALEAGKPCVLRVGKNIVDEVIVVPNKTVRKLHLWYKQSVVKETEGWPKEFFVRSNLGKRDLDRAIVVLKVNSSEFRDENDTLRVYYLLGKKASSLPVIERTGEDGLRVFEFTTEKVGKFRVNLESNERPSGMLARIKEARK